MQFSNGARGFFFCDVSVDFWSSERNFRSRELGCVRFSNMFLRLTVNDDCVFGPEAILSIDVQFDGVNLFFLFVRVYNVENCFLLYNLFNN